MKKAQREKKDQNREKGTTFLTQSTSSNVKTTPTLLTQATSGKVKTIQLTDKDRMDEGSEYDSYVTTATNKTDRKGKEQGGRDTHGNHWQAVMTKVRADEKNPVQFKTFVQAVERQSLERRI